MSQPTMSLMYENRFRVLEVGTNYKGEEIRRVWDNLIDSYAVQDFNVFYHGSDEQVIELFNKMSGKEVKE